MMIQRDTAHAVGDRDDRELNLISLGRCETVKIQTPMYAKPYLAIVSQV